MATSKFKKAFKATLAGATMLVAFAASAQAATAADHNARQDHKGACARTTASIRQAVGDLQFNGVAMAFASKLGIKPFDGSVTKQLNNRLMTGHVAQATVTKNHGCDGHGNVFDAGNRTLVKDEAVKFVRPAKYGPNDVRATPAKGFKKVAITVTVVLPDSCSNLNIGKVKVYFYVKMHPKARKAPKKRKSPATRHSGCDVAGMVVGQNGSCVNQTQTSTETCGNGSNNHASCTTIQVNENCVGVNVCNTTVVTPPDCGCKPPPPPGCTSNCTPPPPCKTNCTPPPVVDVCPNISGNQTTVPAGSKLDSSGNCVKDGNTTPPPPPAAPGTNPPPSSGSPTAQCFDSATGNPVATPADPLHPPAGVVC